MAFAVHAVRKMYRPHRTTQTLGGLGHAVILPIISRVLSFLGSRSRCPSNSFAIVPQASSARLARASNASSLGPHADHRLSIHPNLAPLKSLVQTEIFPITLRKEDMISLLRTRSIVKIDKTTEDLGSLPHPTSRLYLWCFHQAYNLGRSCHSLSPRSRSPRLLSSTGIWKTCATSWVNVIVVGLAGILVPLFSIRLDSPVLHYPTSSDSK